MTRVAALAVVTSVLLATSAGARAEGLYLSEGFGAATVAGELARYYRGGFAVRAAIGGNFGRTTIEGVVTGSELSGEGPFAGREYSAFSYGLAVRRLQPLASWAQLYARGGLIRTTIWSTLGDERGSGYAGRGIELGTGLQVSGTVPVFALVNPWLMLIPALRRGPRVSVAAWIDAGHQVVRLHRERATTLDGAINTLTVGFTLGGRF